MLKHNLQESCVMLKHNLQEGITYESEGLGPMSSDRGEPEPQPEDRRRPLQFRLQSLLWITVGVGLLFGMLRWFEVPPKTSAILLGILVVSVIAALGLVVAIDSVKDEE